MRVDPYSGVPSHTSMVDGFDDADIDSAVWGTKVENGGSGVDETGGFLTITNAAGAAGISYLPSAHEYGNYSICNVGITVVDGEAAGDGERCEASLVWYKDADNYIKWGVYRDTGGAVNSSGYLRYNIGGAGEVATDITSAVIDNDEHTFKLIKHESQIEIYYDGEYQTGFAFTDLINYNVRLEAGTENAGDTIDIDFDNFKMLNAVDPFGTDLTSVNSDLTTILTRFSAVRAGYIDLLADGTVGLAAIEALVDDLETRLSATRAGYLDYLANGTYGLSALNTDLDAIIASLAGGTVTVGTGTMTLTNTDAVALEFTTGTWGSAFELSFFADLDKATTGFVDHAAADTIIEVSYFSKIESAYPDLPQDIFAYQEGNTVDRNITIDFLRCGSDTKIVLQLDKVPTDDVSIPYRYIIRRIKT